MLIIRVVVIVVMTKITRAVVSPQFIIPQMVIRQVMCYVAAKVYLENVIIKMFPQSFGTLVHVLTGLMGQGGLAASVVVIVLRTER